MDNQNNNSGYIPPQQGYPQQGYGQPQGYVPPQQGYMPVQPQRNMYPPRRKKSGLIIGLIIVAALILIMGAVYYVIKHGRSGFDKDYFADKNWLETHSNSYLVTGEGNTFKYYKDKGVYDNYYYEGHYKLYLGDDAYKQITEDLSKYGVTADKLDGIFSKNNQYSKSNLVCLVIENETCWIDGYNMYEDSGTVVTPYYGFYIQDGGKPALDLVNMNSPQYYYFVPEDK